MKFRSAVKLILLSNGLKPKLKGFKYLVDTIEAVSGGKSLKECYITVGKKYGLMPNSIEKSVSNAIETAFNTIEMQEKFCSEVNKSGKISNKKFINVLLKEIKKYN